MQANHSQRNLYVENRLCLFLWWNHSMSSQGELKNKPFLHAYLKFKTLPSNIYNIPECQIIWFSFLACCINNTIIWNQGSQTRPFDRIWSFILTKPGFWYRKAKSCRNHIYSALCIPCKNGKQNIQYIFYSTNQHSAPPSNQYTFRLKGLVGNLKW